MGESQGLWFKVKLTSGRILGPLDLERVRALVRKNQIVGKEQAREYPDGEWKDINHLPLLAEILLAHARGELESQAKKMAQKPTLPGAGLPGAVDPNAPTQVLPSQTQGSLLPGATEAPSMPSLQTLSQSVAAKTSQRPVPELKSIELENVKTKSKSDLATPSGGAPGEQIKKPGEMSFPDPLAPLKEDDENTAIDITGLNERSRLFAFPLASKKERNIHEEKTVVFQRSSPFEGIDEFALPPKPKNKVYLTIRNLIAALGLGIALYQLFFEIDEQPLPIRAAPIKPLLPSYVQGQADPTQSSKLYAEGMRHFVNDHVQGYKTASQKLLIAATLDADNVKALAMLGASYLNLIDSSNKDENYFSVISRLIELSRAKGVDVPETVIADVEFFVTVNKPEAAQRRIVEYTKTHQNFGLEMFYYLSYAFFARGDYQSAARYISQIPDNKVFSARIFYLRGLIAQKLADDNQAIQEYVKAIKFNKDHVKSHLKIAELLSRQGRLKEAAKNLEYCLAHVNLFTPKDLAHAYFLRAQLNALFQKYDLALGDVERAVKLDNENHDYLMELYTLRARLGDNNREYKKEARMYYFLSEGEKILKQGRYQDALTHFLQARESNLDSITPLMKIGDMFYQLNDMANARLNYQKAAERAKNNIQVWSKYIDTLIQSYEWEEAQKAMDRFRNQFASQSAIDKLAGDMYAKQGRHAEAQAFYRKAMARESIDPKVYIAYARSLVATRAYKDAPFFYSLARRFDPLNVEAIIGVAKCVAASEGLDRAINLLQDEVQKNTGAKSELLAAMAELQTDQGQWELAQQNVTLAMNANADYAYPWKLQARIYMNRENFDKTALDKALSAYKSYSDRNLSDPSGYLERYRIFIKKTEYEKASEELSRIFSIYPKYPNLHYYKGALYAVMGNHKVSIDEFQSEVKNNPTNVPALLALGKELIEIGAHKEALEMFQRAMTAAPNAAEPKHMAGYANYLLKNYAGSIALYNAALAYDQGNPLIYKRIGIAYRDMGDRASARKAFQKYLEMEPDASDKAEFQGFL